MATHNWVVYAVSPSLNQRVRYFNLTEMNRQLTEQEARQAADVFAHVQRTNQAMRATDWQPHVELESHGVETLNGYLFHDINR